MNKLLKQKLDASFKRQMLLIDILLQLKNDKGSLLYSAVQGNIIEEENNFQSIYQEIRK